MKASCFFPDYNFESFLDREEKVFVEAPVKINLALHVTGQRADGYHFLQSLVTFSPNGDSIVIEKSSKDSFLIDGVFSAALGKKKENLIMRARDALRRVSLKKLSAVMIRLTKNLPPASGLGGGSSDAAATLVGLTALEPTGLGIRELFRCALAIGADVPMCLAGILYRKSLFVSGIGEKIEILPDFPSFDLVLLNMGGCIATKEVFSCLRKHNNTALFLPTENFSSFEKLSFTLKKARNDLYETAEHMMPSLATSLSLLHESGAWLARMSGSGASCFGAYSSITQANQAASIISTRYPHAFTQVSKTFGTQKEKLSS